jgi:peptide/nickel transport system substrate-binding protein
LKHLHKVIILLLILTISLTACTLPGEHGTNTPEGTLISDTRSKDEVIDRGPVKGGTLRLFSTYPDTLNPVYTNNVYVQDFSQLVFESLVRLGKDLKPLPLLAEKWEVSPDGLTWTFTLKKEVFWHDNRQFSAEDVEFTLESILKHQSVSPYKDSLENIISFSSVNRYTFRILLKKPDSFIVERMTFPILSKFRYKKEEELTNLQSSANRKPVGTGPYRFLSFTDKKLVSLTANSNWWGFSEQDKQVSIPYIAQVDIKLYPNADDSLNAFQIKDVDAIFIGRNECGKYAGRTDMVIKKFLDRNFDFLAFNLSKPLLQDKVLRQAIVTAVNKSKLLEEVMPGEGIPADFPCNPELWLKAGNIQAYDTGASKAKELLIGDGWKEENEVLYKRIKGVKTPLQLELLVNDENDVRAKVAVKLAGQLEAAGIHLQVKQVPWEDSLSLVQQKKFDIVLTGCRIPTIPDLSFLYSSAAANGGLNIAGYANAQVDVYLDRILTERDESLRKAYFTNMFNIISDEVPYIGLYFYYNAGLFSKRVRGEINPYLACKYNGVINWYIPR